MNIEIPFYANTLDNTHCFQAGLKMIMKYFWPNEDYSWEELESITAKVEGLWTWPAAGLLWLQSRGVEVLVIEEFDYEKFAIQGEKYLADEYGEEIARVQVEHSKIEQEQELLKGFEKKVTVKKTIPQIEDIKDLLSQGYVVACNLNAYALDNEEGYAGHFVVVKGFNDHRLFVHDPGLPAKENRSVDFKQFEKAWSYPNAKAKNIMAFKYDKKG